MQTEIFIRKLEKVGAEISAVEIKWLYSVTKLIGCRTFILQRFMMTVAQNMHI